MCQVCGTMSGSGLMVGVEDRQGCLLPLNHGGAHEFVDEYGEHWLWETDLTCDCEHCMQCEGDYCILYWPKPTVLAEFPTRIQGNQPDVDPRQIVLF